MLLSSLSLGAQNPDPSTSITDIKRDIQSVLEQKYSFGDNMIFVDPSAPANYIPILNNFLEALREGDEWPGLFEGVRRLTFSGQIRMVHAQETTYDSSIKLSVPSNFSNSTIFQLIDERLKIYRQNLQTRTDIESILAAKHNYSGEAIALTERFYSNSAMATTLPIGALDKQEATEVLGAFQTLVEEQQFDLSEVNQIYLTHEGRTVEMSSTRNQELILYIPNSADFPGADVAGQLNRKLEFYKSKQKVLQLFRSCCAYNLFTFGENSQIDDSDVSKALEKIERDFSNATHFPNLQDVGAIEFWNGDEVKVERTNNVTRSTLRVSIPINFDVEGNLATEIAEHLDSHREFRRQVFQLRDDMIQILRQKHNYRGGFASEKTVSDTRLASTLGVLKDFFETSPPIPEFAEIRGLKIVEGRNITLSANGLNLPAGISKEFLEQGLPQIFFEYKLEKDVLTLFNERGASIPRISSDPKISRQNYLRGLSNLREMLVSHPNLNLSNVKNVAISSERVVRTYRRNYGGNIDVLIPFDMGSDFLYSGLEARLGFYSDWDIAKRGVHEILRGKRSYKGSDLTLSNNVSEENALSTLESFGQVLEENPFDFSDIAEIIVSNEELASLRYKSVRVRNISTKRLALYLPMNVPQENFPVRNFYPKNSTSIKPKKIWSRF